MRNSVKLFITLLTIVIALTTLSTIISSCAGKDKKEDTQPSIIIDGATSEPAKTADKPITTQPETTTSEQTTKPGANTFWTPSGNNTTTKKTNPPEITLPVVSV